MREKEREKERERKRNKPKAREEPNTMRERGTVAAERVSRVSTKRVPKY